VIYIPTDDEAVVANAVGEWRHVKAAHSKNPPLPHLKEDEVIQQDRDAVLGELTVARALNMYPTGLDKGSKGIADVGYFCEVRMVRPPKPASLQHNDRRHLDSDRREDRPMVFVVVDNRRTEFRRVDILGWDYLSDLFERAVPQRQTHVMPWWRVSMEGLRHIDELKKVALEWLWSKS